MKGDSKSLNKSTGLRYFPSKQRGEDYFGILWLMLQLFGGKANSGRNVKGFGDEAGIGGGWCVRQAHAMGFCRLLLRRVAG